LVQFLKERSVTQDLIPLSRLVWVGSALYASKFPRQQVSKINFLKPSGQQYRAFALNCHPVSREVHSTQFSPLVNTFLKLIFKTFLTIKTLLKNVCSTALSEVHSTQFTLLVNTFLKLIFKLFSEHSRAFCGAPLVSRGTRILLI